MAIPTPANADCLLRSNQATLHIETTPYRFSLEDLSTGVLRRAETTFGIPGNERKAVRAKIVECLDSEATVALDVRGVEGPDPVPVEAHFRFTKPNILSVEYLSYGNVGGFREQFSGVGDRIYGGWAYPKSRRLDNDGEFGLVGPVTLTRDIGWSSIRAPFFFSARGWGVYVPTTDPLFVNFHTKGTAAFSVRSSSLRYHLLAGRSPADALRLFRSLTGPPVVPPLWALGGIWWRDDLSKPKLFHKSSQHNLETDIEELDRRRIPAAAMLIDRPYGTGKQGWGNFDFDPKEFPDPDRMQRTLDDHGLRLMLWISNRVDDKFRRGRVDSALFFHTPESDGWPAMDLSEPAAQSFFVDALKRLECFQVSGYKIDRGDEGEVPMYAVNEMAQTVPFVAARALEGPPSEDFILSRNAYDRAREVTAVWGGDPRTNFESLRLSVQSALRSGLIGFPAWGSDTTGYNGKNRTRDLVARWFAFSAFSPIFEVFLDEEQLLWKRFDARTLEIVAEFAALHHDLMPFFHAGLREAAETGIPFMRPLFLEYPEDPKAQHISDQYLLGPNMLVAPVLEEGTREREVYLPAGEWVDFFDRKKTYKGGESLLISAPLDRIPVFVRSGTSIPRGDIFKGNNTWSKPWKPVPRLDIFPE